MAQHTRTAYFFRAFVCLILAAALFAAAPSSPRAAVPAALPGKEAAGRALRAAERSLGLQTTLPSAGIQPENRLPPEIRPPLPSEAAARVMLWCAIAASVAAVLLSAKRNAWSNSRSRRLTAEKKKAAATAATAARMDKAQTEAEELARQGSFAEAMHVLLLQSVGELRRRLGIPIAASLTSREILRRVRLSPEALDVFADIIDRVELSYFGMREPKQEDYFACRDNFEALTRILRQEALPGDAS